MNPSLPSYGRPLGKEVTVGTQLQPHPRAVPGTLPARTYFIYAGLAASLALNAAWVHQIFGGGVVSPFTFSKTSNQQIDILTGLPVTSPVSPGDEGSFEEIEGSVQGSAADDESQPLDVAGLLADGTTSPKDVFSFPGTDTCGTWPSKYASLHKGIMSGEEPAEKRRYITYVPMEKRSADPYTQVGDAFMGIVSVFLVALLTNRAILIADPAITSTMNPGFVDWRVQDSVPMNLTNPSKSGQNPPASEVAEGAVVQLRFPNKEDVSDKDSVVTFPNILVEYFGAYSNAANLLVSTNGGVISQIFSSNSNTFKALFYNHGFRLPLTYGCVFRFLLRPKADILQPIMSTVEVLEKRDTKSICIGMQGSGTNFSAPLISSEDSLLTCAAAIEDYWFPPSWEVHWLFSSDSKELSQHAAEREPQKVLLLANITSSEGMQLATQEWLLFSLCQYYVISDSTFMKSSLGLNLDAPLVFAYQPLSLGDLKEVCEPSHGHSLLSLKQWNGL